MRDDDHYHDYSDNTSNAPTPSSPTTTSDDIPQRSHRRRPPNLPLNQHYNEPIRQHVWYSKRRTWTREALDRERAEFFDTRVTGRPEVWAALATAISLLRAADTATAQGIVDAAGVTVPTGDLCEGAYDEQGVLYRLPQCIVSDPGNMVRSERERVGQEAGDRDGGGPDAEDDDDLVDGKLGAGGDASGDELIAQDLERRREEKGKTSERDLIRVRARLSDREADLVVSITKSQNVAFLARKLQQEAEVCFTMFLFGRGWLSILTIYPLVRSRMITAFELRILVGC